MQFAPKAVKLALGVVMLVVMSGDVAPRTPVALLNVSDELVFGPRSPVAAVKNAGKHVVSVASFATVIAVGVPAAGVVHDSTPLPSVVNTCDAVPSSTGSVSV